jgi:LuxR family maltose regulon positive regulatory protein
MSEGIATTTRRARRRIIERPRLTRLLDESQGRIKMLVAPAGYGKTTLARQWLANKEAVWYTATPASADVAALAAGLREAVSQLVPGAGDALMERLSSGAEAADPVVLARMLAADLMPWPAHAWLAIDEYHQLGSSESEALIETLVLETHLNVLVQARVRPRWASARRILYGEICEVSRTTLAMTEPEARDLLAGTPRAEELMEVARGWPAVLALASGSRSVAELPEENRLHQFFAEEIYRRIDRDVQRALRELSLYGAEGRALALQQLPPNLAKRVVEVGLDTGLLTEEGDTVTIHPLLREFLTRKLAEQGAPHFGRALRRASRSLIQHGIWDEAHQLVTRTGDPELMGELLAACADSFLTSGRLASLRSWMAQAHQDDPFVRLLGAEVAFREGRFHESESLAVLTANDEEVDGELRTRSYLSAGRAAHAASRAPRAAELYGLATHFAPTPELARLAVLGELSAAIELERPDAPDLLESLGSSESLASDERVTLVIRRINLETRFGLPVSFQEGRAMWQLLNRVTDPVARSSFRNVFGYALAAAGLCEEAERLTQEQMDDAERCGLEFVIPYALTNRAIIAIIQRDYAEGEALLDEADQRARTASDETARFITWAVRTRLFNAQGAFDFATAKPLPTQPGVTKSLESELLACYALAFAGAGEYRRAEAMARRALEGSIAVEVAITAPCALAVAQARQQATPEAVRHARLALDAVTRSSMIESFVCAYRGCPEIVVSLLGETDTHDDLERALASAGDASIGPAASAESRSVLTLSRREKEVLALVAQGLSNIEIGQQLFISAVTVKVHVRHIFEKLGVKSRAEAALRAAQIGRD